MTSTDDDDLKRISFDYNARERARRVAKYERQLADPGLTYSGKPTRPHAWPEWQREEFREWAGDRFPAWYEQARARIAEREDVRDFEAAWHPRGEHAYWAERAQKQLAQTVQDEYSQFLGWAAALSDAELGARLREAAAVMANRQVAAETDSVGMATVGALFDLLRGEQ